MMKSFYLSISFLLVSVFVCAQDANVSGRVTKANTAEPLQGVTVSVKGTKTKTSTNSEGRYTITVPNPNSVLVFSYVGHLTREMNAGGAGTVDVSMDEDESKLNEVVVIGYQTVRRKDLTSSVSSISDKQLKDIPVNSTAEALAGRLAGVQVTVSEGAPGAEATINIRGRNSITQDGSPLYIVDGVQIDDALSILSPQDIATIDVLKDAASTAIYGARGSNGVVIITTKGGRNTNGKTTVTYNGFVGVQRLARKLDVMDPYNYVLYQYERSLMTGDSAAIKRYLGVPFDLKNLDKYRNEPFVDWQERTMGRNALQQSHNVSVSGGTVNTQYNLSLTSNRQEGILLNSDYDRKLVNFKFDHKANNKLRFGFTVRFNDQTVNGAGTSDVGGSNTNRLRQFVRYRPVLLSGYSEDEYDPELEEQTRSNGLSLINPLLIVDAQYRQRNTTVYNLSGYFNYNLFSKLSFRSTVGFDHNDNESKSFDDTLSSATRSFNRQPLIDLRNTRRLTLNNSNVLTYNNPALFDTRHTLDGVLGQETYQTITRSNDLSLRWFPVGVTPDIAFANHNLATAPAGLYQPKPESSEIPVNNLSFFSRLNYSFDRKYLFSAIIRADGSSIFGEGNKWGYFPSASVAWRVSQENFMQNVDFISDLKLRFSYGTSGNNRIAPFSYATTYVAGVGYSINHALAGSYTPERLGNKELKWEVLVSRNLGMDLELFNRRVQVTVDAYDNVTRDLLVNVAIPTSSGYRLQFQNVGSTSNKGIETQIGATIIEKKNFSWETSFNLSFNKNKIRSLGDQEQYLFNSGWFNSNNPSDYLVKVGEEVGTMWGLVNDGFYTLDDFTTQPYSNSSYPNYTTEYILKPGVPVSNIGTVKAQPGMQKFKDINGDSIVNDLDRTIIGRAQPKFFGGINQMVRYRNFDASIFINFSYGNQTYNANKIEFTSGYSPDANLLTDMITRWRIIDEQGNRTQQLVNNNTQVVGIDPSKMASLNANTTTWTPVTGANAFYPQSFAIEDGSFIRISNVTVGYSLPASLLKRVKIANLRLYATANNLGLITNYSGYDPEANTRRGSPVTMGVDYAGYPRSQTFIFGVNLSL